MKRKMRSVNAVAVYFLLIVTNIVYLFRLSKAKLSINIDWKRTKDYPSTGTSDGGGFQDSDGGWVNDTHVLTAFGTL